MRMSVPSLRKRAKARASERGSSLVDTSQWRQASRRTCILLERARQGAVTQIILLGDGEQLADRAGRVRQLRFRLGLLAAVQRKDGGLGQLQHLPGQLDHKFPLHITLVHRCRDALRRADVVRIGGGSGRESEVHACWAGPDLTSNSDSSIILVPAANDMVKLALMRRETVASGRQRRNTRRGTKMTK